ncbi:MAG: 30S ribosomal protein S16 [Phycisphaerales bacterium]
MVRIRMQRMGRRNRPFFRINVIDEQTRRDGKVIEQLGWYDPIAKDESKQVQLDEDRAKYWLSQGAQPSDTMMDMLSKRKLVDGEAWKARRAWRVKARQAGLAKKAAAEAAAKDAKKS